MTRRYRITTATHRICYRCDRNLPITAEWFYSDNRAMRRSYECLDCLKERKIGRDRSGELTANMTPDQIAKKNERNRRYRLRVKDISSTVIVHEAHP